MNYNPDASPVRSLDVAGTETPNHRRYISSNCLLRLNGQGLPVAIRYVPSIGHPGSFASRRYQAVKPNGNVALSPSALRAWMEKAHPAN